MQCSPPIYAMKLPQLTRLWGTNTNHFAQVAVIIRKRKSDRWTKTEVQTQMSSKGTIESARSMPLYSERDVDDTSYRLQVAWAHDTYSAGRIATSIFFFRSGTYQSKSRMADLSITRTSGARVSLLICSITELLPGVCTIDLIADSV